MDLTLVIDLKAKTSLHNQSVNQMAEKYSFPKVVGVAAFQLASSNDLKGKVVVNGLLEFQPTLPVTMDLSVTDRLANVSGTWT